MTSAQLSVFSGISQADSLSGSESLQGVSSGDALTMYSQVGMIEDDNSDILQENDYNVSSNDYVSYQGEYVLYQDVESATTHSMFCLFIFFSSYEIFKISLKAFIPTFNNVNIIQILTINEKPMNKQNIE